jgi:hypothetical protein
MVGNGTEIVKQEVRTRENARRIRTLPRARGLQPASVSERAKTKRLTCGLSNDEARLRRFTVHRLWAMHFAIDVRVMNRPEGRTPGAVSRACCPKTRRAVRSRRQRGGHRDTAAGGGMQPPRDIETSKTFLFDLIRETGAC